MAYTTNMVTQNGNTTNTWTVSGGSISTHDCLVLKPISGSSGLKITSKKVYLSPTRYKISVQVIGSGAMAFRVSAERMN